MRGETSYLDNAFGTGSHSQDQTSSWQYPHCQRAPYSQSESFVVVPPTQFRIAHRLSYSENRRIGTCFLLGSLHDTLADKLRMSISCEETCSRFSIGASGTRAIGGFFNAVDIEEQKRKRAGVEKLASRDSWRTFCRPWMEGSKADMVS